MSDTYREQEAILRKLQIHQLNPMQEEAIPTIERVKNTILLFSHLKILDQSNLKYFVFMFINPKKTKKLKILPKENNEKRGILKKYIFCFCSSNLDQDTQEKILKTDHC